MTLKPISACVILSLAIAGCSTTTTKQTTITTAESTVKPLTYTEPTVSPPFYALNPFNYNEPPAFEVALKEAASRPVQILEVTVDGNTQTLNKNRLIVPLQNSKTRDLRFAVVASANELDVTDIDDFLTLLEGKARHYPPRFVDRREKNGFSAKLKQITAQLDTLAVQPNASFDIVLRAFKASLMAKNMDLGPIYTTKALAYSKMLQNMQANDAEVNFWFGFGLSEGGGHKEAVPYLDKAMKAGVQEAYLAAVNNFLALSQKQNAINTLKNYAIKFPTEKEVSERLVNEINKENRWNVWQILKQPAS